MGTQKILLWSFKRGYRINILVLEITCAILAVISVWLYGNGSRYAPLFGLFCQMFWITWTIQGNHYPMLILCIFMVGTHIRNYFVMRNK